MSQTTCERCGFPLPVDARFCPNCGNPVQALGAEERKVVTLLFADVAGSTELNTRLDPERFRAVMASFFQLVTEELESLRGRAESYAGDAVLGVFGIPQAHDDDALRAVRAALSIRERVERLGASLALPLPLRVRIGINTGPVAVAPGPSGQLHMAGPDVHLTARLQQSAEPAEILVAEMTWQLTRDSVEFGRSRKLLPKGFDGEIEVFPVAALSTRSSRRTIPLVNRRRELTLLSDAFDRAVETSRTHLVSLLGEPGIGKSRVAQEFVATLPESTRVLRGRATAFEESLTFGPLAEMIRREISVDRAASREETRSKLEEIVAGCCEPTEVEQIVARLGLALGIGEEPRDEHMYRIAEIRSGLIAFLAGITRSGPAVLVFDDLHLAQQPLLELIEQLARDARRVPVLLLCVARPELYETRADWAGGLRDALTLQLEPLSDADAAHLARHSGEGLDEQAAARIAAHAGGNPFFIVETTGMLLHERGATPSTYGAAPAVAGLLPPTVQAVVAARIDHLRPDARLLVRLASIFPRGTFSESDLALIADPNEEILRLLEDEELLVPEDGRPGMWRFRHGLLRDVAYESLAKRERARLHLELGEKFQAMDPERYPHSIAYHFEQAAKAALDLDPTDRTLADRAVDALTRAGDRARRGIESRRAIDMYERALGLAGPERGWGRREAWIFSAIGEARYWLGEFEAAESPLSRALELGGDDVWVKSHACRFLGDIALSVHEDQDRAGRLFDEALAAARELGDPFVLARTLLSAGWAPNAKGNLEGAKGIFEEALEIARTNDEGDEWAEARALVQLAVVISPVEDARNSERLAREALAIGERIDDAFTIAVASVHVANSLRRMLRLDEAAAPIDRAVAIFRELDARWELADALTSRGVIRRFSGRLEEAETDLREVIRLCRKLRERTLLTWAGSELIKVLVLAGDVPSARQVMEEVMSLLGGSALVRGVPSEDFREALVVVLLAEGERQSARELDAEQLEGERRRAQRNPLAAQVWRTSRLFGPEAAGGPDEVERARRILADEAHWEQALRAPELQLFGEPVPAGG